MVDGDDSRNKHDDPMNINSTFSAFTEIKKNTGENKEIDLEAIKMRIKKKGADSNLDPKKLTNDMLKEVHIIRPRNLSV